MATVSALSTLNRRKLRTRGFEDFVDALYALDSDAELAVIIKVDSDDGDIHITHLSGMTALLPGIANSSNDDIRVSRSAGGVLTAAATP